MEEENKNLTSGEAEVSPGELFEKMIQDIHSEAGGNRANVVGLVGADEEKYEQIMRFVNTEEGLEAMTSLEDSVNYGIVHNVREIEGKTLVNYVNDKGLLVGFQYEQGVDRFSDAPDGFGVGDIILTELVDGNTIKSIKPVNLDPDSRLSLIEDIRDKFNKHQESMK